ncbi:MAG TPA: RDD family protein [Polyangiales bacterium]|nr:RDD family protein [Polyangiales bacterium]
MPSPDLPYAGFWRRLMAMWIDGTLVAAVDLAIYVLAPVNWGSFVAQSLATKLAAAALEVYLVHRYGGTPGKLALGLRVVMADGTPVTWAAALYRIAISFPLGLARELAGLHVVMQIPQTELGDMSWLQLGQRMHELETRLHKAIRLTQGAWVWADLFTMLSNDRKRAIHDFVAGTVVIRVKP